MRIKFTSTFVAVLDGVPNMRYLKHVYVIFLISFIVLSKPLYANNVLITDAINACNDNNIENFEKIILPLVNDGNSNAQYVLGNEYLKTFYCGRTVQPNYKEAVSLLKKAALQKHISASLTLSKLYNPAGLGAGKVRSDYMQSLKWALLANSFNNEFANITPSNSDHWNSEKYQNDFETEKQFNANKIFIRAATASIKKSVTEEHTNLVDLHVNECLKNLSSCKEIINASNKNETTKISDNSQNLVCEIKKNNAVPCTEEKKIELEGRNINILKTPMSCGKNVSTEFIDVIVDKDNNTISVDNVSTKICSGEPTPGKEAIFRQHCDPIEDDYLTKDGFLQGKLIYFSGSSETEQIAKLESERKKQLIQNLDTTLVTKIIQPPSTIAYSFGKCYLAEKKEFLVKKHEEYMKQKELDDIAEKKLKETKDKYADAPSCRDLPYMEKYKKKASKVNMDIMLGNPPEPCKKSRGTPGSVPEILLPKSMR